MTVKDNRNYGIDLLRIVSMFMVVCIHVLNIGGVLWVVDSNDAKFAGNVLFTFCMCAVNTFAMISGYVMVQSYTIHISKLVKLWFQVFFYCFISTLIYSFYRYLNGMDFLSIKDVIKCSLPIIGNRYWYFTAYFVLFIFIPVLNLGLSQLERNKYRLMLMIIFILSIFISIFGDRFGFSSGYHFSWLLVCYIFGAYFKLFPNSIRNRYFLILYAVVGILLGTYRFASQLYKLPYSGMFTSYTSPFYIINSCCLVIVFSRIKFHSNVIIPLISFLSNGAFGVYLFHENPFFRDNVMSHRFDCIGRMGGRETGFCYFIMCNNDIFCWQFDRWMSAQFF